MVVSVSVFYPHDHVADQEGLPLPSTMNKYQTTYHLAGKRSQFKVWFLLNAHHFHTAIKSKNYKSDPVCIL